MTTKNYPVLLAHALVAWAICAAVIGIGFSIGSERAALVAHAVAVPLVFATTAGIYFTHFDYTAPIQTAVVFMVSAIALDLVIMALLIQRDLSMFASLLGTWIPFVTILLTTYVVGVVVRRRKARLALATQRRRKEMRSQHMR